MTATLPQSSVDPTPAINTDSVVTVTPSQDLQAALNAAKPGQTIALTSGAMYKVPPGGLVWPAKLNPTGKWTNIITDSVLAQNAHSSVRANPDRDGDFATLLTFDSGPVLSTATGSGAKDASFLRLTGLEIGVAGHSMKDAKLQADSNSGLLRLGDPAETDLANISHDFIVDRCLIFGDYNLNTLRGIALNCARAAVINSSLGDFHAIGSDSQAIHGANGPGPFLIENNYLEGAGENIMFGGADPKISGLIPSDITIRRNTFSKPLSWKHNDPSFGGYLWSVKNLLELKNAQRVLVEGNTFSNSWAMAQAGWIFSLKSVNQDGSAPWSVCQDVTIRHNIGHGAGGVFNLQGSDPDNKSGQTARISAYNNLFYDIASTWNDGITGPADGCFIKEYEITDLLFDHNTALCDGNIIIAYGTKKTAPFSFTYNLLLQNQYGIKGDNTASGDATLAAYFDLADFGHNAFIGTGSGLAAAIASIGFIDPASGNYALKPGSLYRGAGGDMAALQAAMSGAPAPVVAPVVTKDELWAAMQTLKDMMERYLAK